MFDDFAEAGKIVDARGFAKAEKSIQEIERTDGETESEGEKWNIMIGE